MNKSLLILLLTLLLGCQSNNSYSTSLNTADNLVIVCLGSGAYAYHKHHCQGLDRCEAETKEVTIDEAKAMHRGKPCGYCYGN